MKWGLHDTLCFLLSVFAPFFPFGHRVTMSTSVYLPHSALIIQKAPIFSSLTFCYLSACFILSSSAFYELFTHIFFAFSVDVQRFHFISSVLLARRTVMAFIHQGVPTFVAHKNTLLCEDFPDVVALTVLTALRMGCDFRMNSMCCVHARQKHSLYADRTKELFDRVSK